MDKFGDIVRRIVSGEGVEDVVDELLENVTPAHEQLGKLKAALRELKTLSTRGFSTTISGTPSPSQSQAAKAVDTLLIQLLGYWSNKRVPELQGLKGHRLRNFEIMCDETRNLATALGNANANDTIISAAIRATEAADRLSDIILGD